ncbi:hypothetical protein PNEG_02923 [Pneumocystis murina B123]|uniref:Uncharacterized protein n=1 Tax=Pneumocystis murina (strain B123) TaxID=1069680 RepID=M7P4J5_PNEMU|nr:hypothetical protein PNEG_02923 [Pneumocystis murina B123]EMR08750.1 hypothetical protein PNEG_02923 [Pneumocystis murina B123]
MGLNRYYYMEAFLNRKYGFFFRKKLQKKGKNSFFFLNHIYKYNNDCNKVKDVIKTKKLSENYHLENKFPKNKDIGYLLLKKFNKIENQYDLHILKELFHFLWSNYHIFKKGNFKIQLDKYLKYIFIKYHQKFELNNISITFRRIKQIFLILLHKNFIKWIEILSNKQSYSEILFKNLDSKTNCQKNSKLFLFYQPNVCFPSWTYINFYINDNNMEVFNKKIQKEINIHDMWKKKGLYPLENNQNFIYKNWNEILNLKIIRKIYGSRTFQRSYTKTRNKYSNIIQDIQNYIEKKNYNNCNRFASRDISSISTDDLKQFQYYVEPLLENLSKQGDIFTMNKVLRLLRELDHGMIDQSYFLIKTHLNLLLNTSSENSYQKLLPKYDSETTFFYDSFKSSLPKVPTISHWKLILQFYIKANKINSLSFPSSFLINSLLQIQISKLKPPPEIYFMVIYALVVSPEFRPLGSDYCQETQFINTTVRIKKVLEVVKIINNEIDFNINKEKIFHALYLACCPSIIEVLEYTTDSILSLANQNFNNANLILDPRAFLIEDLMVLHEIPYSFKFEKLRFTVLASCNLWDVFWRRFKDLSIREPQKDENFYILIFKLINDSKNKKQIQFALEVIWPSICEQLKINATPKITNVIDKLRNHRS